MATAQVKPTAAAVWPEGKDEESGRSRTSSCEIHSFGGRRRSHSCLTTPLDTISATAMLTTPAAAARRPRHPPAVAMRVAAPHHSLVCCAASSTAGSMRRAQVDRHDATRRVSR